MSEPVTASPAWDPADFRARIQATLDGCLDEHAARLEPLGPDAALLIDAARTAVRGGKRFRAAFCHWGYRAIAGTAGSAGAAGAEAANPAALDRACASLELLHASALVHDDYMDASDTRRGRPATHRAFEGAHRAQGWRGDPAQYGASAAILLGDLLLTWADEALRRSGLPPESVWPAMDVFDLCRSEVVAGQFLDVSVQARGSADVEAAMTVLRYKSAKYSIERPLHVGAALAGATAADLEALSAYGLPLGEAFQLRDDLLGVFGDPEVTGKPAGDDLVEGKRTVLVALALEGAGDADARLLDDALGRESTPEQIARLQQVIAESGAQRRVETMIEDLMQRSLAALEQDRFGAEAEAALRQLAESVTRRAL